MHQQAVAKNEKIQEIRIDKGEEDHPSTLYNIAMMIQIYINEGVDNTIKIMEDNDFHGFRKSLDKKMKNLISSGHCTPQDKQKVLLNKWNKNYAKKSSWME